MKPGRRIFNLALDQLEVAGERAMFVGDRLDNDVWGASRVGMTTVHLSHGKKARWAWTRPDYTVRRLGELPPILQSLKS